MDKPHVTLTAIDQDGNEVRLDLVPAGWRFDFDPLTFFKTAADAWDAWWRGSLLRRPLSSLTRHRKAEACKIRLREIV